MTVASIETAIGIIPGFSNVQLGIPCVNVRSVSHEGVAELSSVRGLRQQVQPMTAGFSPTVEALQSYPQGSDREEIAESTVFEGAAIVTLALLPGLGGYALDPRSVASITGRLFNETEFASSGSKPLQVKSLAPLAAMRGQVITGDPRWLRAGGFNFEHVWSGEGLAGGGRSYRLEYEVRFEQGGALHTTWVRHRITVRSILSLQ